MKDWILSNILTCAVLLGGGAMAVGAFSVKLELAEVRADLRVTQRDVAHVREALDDLRGVRRRDDDVRATSWRDPDVVGSSVR